jgi:hypothetical protein
MKTCEQLTEQMDAFLETLTTELVRRMMYRIVEFSPSHLSTIDILRISDGLLHELTMYLNSEEQLSKVLGTMHVRYRVINHAVQTTFEPHSDVLETLLYHFRPFGHERATDNLLCLRKKTTYFNKMVQHLLHAVYLPGVEGFDYLCEYRYGT